MPAKNPRINLVLDDILYKSVKYLAKKENISLSAKVRDLVKEALEIQEDIVLGDFAGKREESWKNSDALSHNDVWE